MSNTTPTGGTSTERVDQAMYNLFHHKDDLGIILQFLMEEARGLREALETSNHRVTQLELSAQRTASQMQFVTKHMDSVQDEQLKNDGVHINLLERVTTMEEKFVKVVDEMERKQRDFLDTQRDELVGLGQSNQGDRDDLALSHRLDDAEDRAREVDKKLSSVERELRVLTGRQKSFRQFVEAALDNVQTPSYTPKVVSTGGDALGADGGDVKSGDTSHSKTIKFNSSGEDTRIAFQDASSTLGPKLRLEVEADTWNALMRAGHLTTQAGSDETTAMVNGAVETLGWHRMHLDNLRKDQEGLAERCAELNATYREECSQLREYLMRMERLMYFRKDDHSNSIEMRNTGTAQNDTSDTKTIQDPHSSSNNNNNNTNNNNITTTTTTAPISELPAAALGATPAPKANTRASSESVGGDGVNVFGAGGGWPQHHRGSDSFGSALDESVEGRVDGVGLMGPDATKSPPSPLSTVGTNSTVATQNTTPQPLRHTQQQHQQQQHQQQHQPPRTIMSPPDVRGVRIMQFPPPPTLQTVYVAPAGTQHGTQAAAAPTQPPQTTATSTDTPTRSPLTVVKAVRSAGADGADSSSGNHSRGSSLVTYNHADRRADNGYSMYSNMVASPHRGSRLGTRQGYARTLPPSGGGGNANGSTMRHALNHVSSPSDKLVAAGAAGKPSGGSVQHVDITVPRQQLWTRQLELRDAAIESLQYQLEMTRRYVGELKERMDNPPVQLFEQSSVMRGLALRLFELEQGTERLKDLVAYQVGRRVAVGGGGGCGGDPNASGTNVTGVQQHQSDVPSSSSGEQQQHDSSRTPTVSEPSSDPASSSADDEQQAPRFQGAVSALAQILNLRNADQLGVIVSPSEKLAKQVLGDSVSSSSSSSVAKEAAAHGAFSFENATRSDPRDGQGEATSTATATAPHAKHSKTQNQNQHTDASTTSDQLGRWLHTGRTLANLEGELARVRQLEQRMEALMTGRLEDRIDVMERSLEAEIGFCKAQLPMKVSVADLVSIVEYFSQLAHTSSADSQTGSVIPNAGEGGEGSGDSESSEASSSSPPPAATANPAGPAGSSKKAIAMPSAVNEWKSALATMSTTSLPVPGDIRKRQARQAERSTRLGNSISQDPTVATGSSLGDSLSFALQHKADKNDVICLHDWWARRDFAQTHRIQALEGRVRKLAAAARTAMPARDRAPASPPPTSGNTVGGGESEPAVMLGSPWKELSRRVEVLAKVVYTHKMQLGVVNKLIGGGGGGGGGGGDGGGGGGIQDAAHHSIKPHSTLLSPATTSTGDVSLRVSSLRDLSAQLKDLDRRVQGCESSVDAVQYHTKQLSNHTAWITRNAQRVATLKRQIPSQELLLALSEWVAGSQTTVSDGNSDPSQTRSDTGESLFPSLFDKSRASEGHNAVPPSPSPSNQLNGPAGPLTVHLLRQFSQRLDRLQAAMEALNKQDSQEGPIVRLGHLVATPLLSHQHATLTPAARMVRHLALGVFVSCFPLAMHVLQADGRANNPSNPNNNPTDLHQLPAHKRAVRALSKQLQFVAPVVKLPFPATGSLAGPDTSTARPSQPVTATIATKSLLNNPTASPRHGTAGANPSLVSDARCYLHRNTGGRTVANCLGCSRAVSMASSPGPHVATVGMRPDPHTVFVNGAALSTQPGGKQQRDFHTLLGAVEAKSMVRAGGGEPLRVSVRTRVPSSGGMVGSAVRRAIQRGGGGSGGVATHSASGRIRRRNAGPMRVTRRSRGSSGGSKSGLVLFGAESGGGGYGGVSGGGGGVGGDSVSVYVPPGAPPTTSRPARYFTRGSTQQEQQQHHHQQQQQQQQQPPSTHPSLSQPPAPSTVDEQPLSTSAQTQHATDTADTVSAWHFDSNAELPRANEVGGTAVDATGDVDELLEGDGGQDAGIVAE